MENIISGTTGGPLVPINNNVSALVVQPVPNTAETKIVVPEKNIEQLNPWTHHNTVSGIRSALYPLDTLRKFVDWQRDNLTEPELVKIRKAVKSDLVIKQTIDDLLPQFEKLRVNLIEVLKNRLVESSDFDEKLVYLKVLFSTSNEDIFINDVLVPYLEQRKEYKNLKCTNRLCSDFLTLLDDEELVAKVVEQIDYKKINDMDIFAESIVRMVPPEMFINRLFDLNEELISKQDDSREHYINMEAVQDTLLALIEQGYRTELLVLPSDKLSNIYNTTVDMGIMGEAGDMLAAYYPSDAPKVFKEKLLDKPDESEKTRRKRFRAIGDYAICAKGSSAKTLGEFINKETDFFLVGHACYSMVNFASVDGNSILMDTIVKQIRRQESSIPLASTIKLMPYGDRYKKIISNVLSRFYKADEGLKKALCNLEGAELCPIGRSDSGGTLFNLVRDEENNLVIELIKGIGFENLIHDATNSKTDISQEEQWKKNNSLEIIEYAWEKNRNQMMNLFLEAVPFSNSNDLDSIIKQMVGMNLAGTSDEKTDDSKDNKAV